MEKEEKKKERLEVRRERGRETL
jgi:hypothetical protein